MNILRTWIDAETKQERAKLYRNIDPKSICIVGHTIYFAHPDTWKPNSTMNKYRIDLVSCDFLTADPVVIDEEMKRFDFPCNGDLGYYNQVADLKN